MSDYMRVCAVDVGTRNFAFCIVDTMNWRHPLVWQHEDLWAVMPGRRRKPTKDDLVRITVAWCKRNYAALKECDHIVLENQIRTPFIIMNTVIQTLFLKRTTVVHPMTVATFFKLPKTRELKKAATVELVRLHAQIPAGAHKLDDLADTWIMAIHALVMHGGISKKELFSYTALKGSK
jgi:hypothetical protein